MPESKKSEASPPREPFVLRDELVEAMRQLEAQVYLTPQEVERSLRTVEERLRQLVDKPGPRPR